MGRFLLLVSASIVVSIYLELFLLKLVKILKKTVNTFMNSLVPYFFMIKIILSSNVDRTLQYKKILCSSKLEHCIYENVVPSV